MTTPTEKKFSQEKQKAELEKILRDLRRWLGNRYGKASRARVFFGSELCHENRPERC